MVVTPRYAAPVPEVLEVESYRELAERVVGSRIRAAEADRYAAAKLVAPRAFAHAAVGRRVVGTGRRGKLLWLETDGVRLGLRFGMTGVLLLDGDAGIEGLFYGPHDYRDEWVRASLTLDDGRRLILHDPRRLGRVEIDPSLEGLGPDVIGLSRADFDAALATRGEGPAVKARLLDQAMVAGIGNLLADEMLFRAGVDPRTPVGRLDAARRARLFRALGQTIRTLRRRGGSHTGDHMAARHPDGRCPRDGTALAVATVGGRTTYWCPTHQR